MSPGLSVQIWCGSYCPLSPQAVLCVLCASCRWTRQEDREGKENSVFRPMNRFHAGRAQASSHGAPALSQECQLAQKAVAKERTKESKDFNKTS